MITVEEAKRLLFTDLPAPKTVEVKIENAFGFVLVEDILSPIDLPLFNQSMMDGYAIASGSALNQRQFNLIGEIKAGDGTSVNLKNGDAIRIFTGAPVPATADAVIIQEKVKQENGSIYLSDDIQQGNFIRLRGSQIKQGEPTLKKFSLLNPASIGFLASLGIGKVKVYTKPVVSILVTGDEIIMPGNPFQEGKVYESNSISLHAALEQMQTNIGNILTAKDDKKQLKERIEECLSASDIILITGGISVGKYDYVHEVLKELNVETIFYKVSQKPGKPLFAGRLRAKASAAERRLNDKLVFALPGNPASVLVCFYEYVYPAIRRIQGIKSATLPTVQLKTKKDISTQEDRACFIQAKRIDDGIMPLDKQDSSMLRSFAEADALIYVPIQKEIIKAGDMVEVHLLPFNI